jgi:hypothetical protein
VFTESSPSFGSRIKLYVVCGRLPCVAKQKVLRLRCSEFCELLELVNWVEINRSVISNPVTVIVRYDVLRKNAKFLSLKV